MTSPSSPARDGTAQTGQLTRIVARPRRRQVVGALFCIGLGAILLAANLGVLPAGVMRFVQVAWPLLLIAAGLIIGLSGLGALHPPARAFAVERGQVQAAHLRAVTGLADLYVRAFAGTSQLAVGQFSGEGGPGVELDGSQASLSLDGQATIPYFTGGWSATLVKGLPWTLNLRSHLGHFDLDLRDLTVTTLRLSSLAGNVDLTLPATGQGDMDVQLILGDLRLRVPEGMAVKLRLGAGPLVRASVDTQRFIPTAPREWVTPNFSTAPQRYTLSVRLSLGDLEVV